MAELELFQNINGQGVIELKGVRAHNIADQAAQDAFQLVGNFGSPLDISNDGLVIYRKDTKRLGTWDGTQFVFSMVSDATVDDAGVVFLATQSEADTGISAQPNTAVTPETLESKLKGAFYVKQFTGTMTLAASTPLNVSHNLNLITKDSFTINVIRNGSVISVDVDSVDANNLTLTSLVPLTDLQVTIQGATADA